MNLSLRHKYNKEGLVEEVLILDGWRQRYLPNHPNAKGGQIYEHRLVAATALGKPLPEKAVVHHHDDGTLVICQDQGYHNLLHARMRAIDVTGDPNKRICTYCKQWDNLSLLGGGNGRATYHRNCKMEYERERNRKLWEEVRKERENG
jgi:hypothetical protein